jgi:hypothetical protein
MVMTFTGLMSLSAPASAQHGGPEHLRPVQKNVQVVGTLDLFGNNEQPGRIADVAVHGNYAYLGAFASPNCENPGVYVIDISNPAAPKEADFIPTSDPSAFVGEGVQVLEMNTEFYKGPLLLYSQETCAPQGGAVLGPDPRLGLGGRGGATLVDVRDPENWVKLADHIGDNDPPPPGGLPFGFPHNSHSVFGWQQGDRAYMIVMDNGETADIDVFDITNPAAPEFVVETGLDDFPQVTEEPAPNGASAFIHDFVVKKVDDKYLFLGSYWDGGYIIMDFTDLANDNVTFLRDTDFGAEEPFRDELGLPGNTPPEGNAHQAEFSSDNKFFIGADEDFQPYRFLGRITSGVFANESFSASQGSATPPVGPEGLAGPVEYVGSGCPTPLAPSPDHIALAERGPGNTCPFAAKVQAAEAAGYKAVVVFNDQTTDAPNCDALANPLAVGNIPMLFVGRSTGLKLLGTPPGANSCNTATPPLPPGTDAAGIDVRTLYDGWGYMHLYDANTMQALDHWALPESLQEANAFEAGDLTVHEVAMDPKLNRAYISHYGGGFRVFNFSRQGGLRQVGKYIAPGGSNFWGVEVHNLPGRAGQVVLASDRDAGLWIFDTGRSRCGGQDATLAGTAARDKIKGTKRRDVIQAGTGADRIRAGKGKDYVCGRRGKDRLSGGGKRDVLVGSKGNDLLIGGPGRDVCRGGKGRDEFVGCEVERG